MDLACCALPARAGGGARLRPGCHCLSDFYVEYDARAYLATPADERRSVLSGWHAHILDCFNDFGVQILVPHFESQPEGRVVVAKDHWFAAPAQSPGSAPSKRPRDGSSRGPARS